MGNTLGRFFITGADGFVGQHLCAFLKTKNTDFVAGVRGQATADQVAYGDLLQQEDWSVYLKNIDTIVHLAARLHIMNEISEDPSTEFRKINVYATLNLAQQAKVNGVRKFIFLSTAKVNGEKTYTHAFGANDKPSPEDPYSVSKYEAEIALLSLHDPNIFDVVIIRPPLIYGKGVKANFNLLMKLAKLPIPLPFGSVQNKRSLLSVLNLCDLIFECSQNPKANGQILMAADEKTYCLQDLIFLLAKLAGRKAWFISVPVSFMVFVAKIFGLSKMTDRLFGNLEVDISKTKNLLNWKPPFSFEDTFINLKKDSTQ